MTDALVTLPVDGFEAVSLAATLGGHTTVLPRLQRDERGTQLVSTERPRFETTAVLGRGGLGEVVAANDLDIGRKVAIKRIRPDRATRGAFLRFVQEVRTVGALDHPNIIPIHDVAKDEQGQYYFVMKHVDGETLSAILERLRAGDRATHAAYGFERRAAIFVQICHAVAFAHSRGVLHRDLKPDNVMVGTHGEVTLLDWGVAKSIDAPDVVDAEHAAEDAHRSLTVTQTRVGQLIGTPRYMAPEQARGEPVDVRTDVYALCLLLFEWLGLKHPFDGLTELDQVLAAARDPHIPNLAYERAQPIQGGVPADLAWIVHDGLFVDPDRRYPHVQAIIDRFERRADGHIDVQCAVTMQLSMTQRVNNLARRRPFLLLAAVMTTAAAAAAALLAVGAVLGATFGGTLAWWLT